MTRAALVFDAIWLSTLRARANQPRLRPRVPLLAGAGAVGRFYRILCIKSVYGPRPMCIVCY